MKTLEFVKKHQQKIVLAIGFILVAGITFMLGRMTASGSIAPEIKVEQAFTPSNYTPNVSGTQSNAAEISNIQPTATAGLDCQGKIKGSSSLIYHLPGGASYNRTTKPIRCFDTEAEAQAAGFRKAAQ